MKNLVVILIAFILLGSLSCKKTNDTPTDTTYTVKYSIVSTGDVEVDTIIYLNSAGVEETLVNQNQFSHSFESVNSYHGKLYISGITNNGSCDYALQILEGEGIIKDNSSGSQSTVPVSFTFSGEFTYSED